MSAADAQPTVAARNCAIAERATTERDQIALWTTDRDARMSWWRDARFGMFIHWGPVSLKGTEISWSRANTNPKCPNRGEIDAAVYDNLYKDFNPTRFDAEGSAGDTHVVETDVGLMAQDGAVLIGCHRQRAGLELDRHAPGHGKGEGA